jgi:nicotinate phosphoribosyltransferase
MSWVTDANAALLTDLYELTMADSYFRRNMNDEATFDLFVRRLPEERNFMVACGLEQAIDFLETMSFGDDAIEYLASLERFSDGFLDYLRTMAFTGEVWAVPEGEIAFANQPLLRVTAPLIEAQIVETFLLNCVIFQTMIASKAARVSIACGDKIFVDFSPRRDHGADAALKAARASFVGGATSTSNVLAGQVYGIPVTGTMAHSYVMAFDDEEASFRAFASDFPKHAVLLIDTFDVEEGARRAARAGRELARSGGTLLGVRIDSGDLDSLSRLTRKILDEAGLDDTKVSVSGDLDEYRIEDLVSAGAPIDSFGVGTQLGTSGDAPSLGGVYKLVDDSSAPRIKLSTGKVTIPGRKQVLRFPAEGTPEHDIIALEDEELAGGRPILERVVLDGRRVDEPESLEAIRERCRARLAELPAGLKSLRAHSEYDVRLSDGLEALVREARATHERAAG